MKRTLASPALLYEIDAMIECGDITIHGSYWSIHPYGRLEFNAKNFVLPAYHINDRVDSADRLCIATDDPFWSVNVDRDQVC